MIEGGSYPALAQSIPQNEPFSSGSEATVVEEVERLAGRRLTRAEAAVARALVDGCSVWADGLKPESLAHLAVGLASARPSATRKSSFKVLFVSPSSDLLEHRQLRLGRRGPCQFARDAIKQSTGDSGLMIWSTPDALDSVLLGRLFGSSGPDIVVVEEAESCTPESVSYRPSWLRLGELLKRWRGTQVLISAHCSGQEFRTKVSRLFHSPQFEAPQFQALQPTRASGFSHKACPELTTPSAGAILICESTYLPGWDLPQGEGVSLRVQEDENQSVASLVGPLPRPALVLCSTPAQADQVFAELDEEQIPVHRFHAGLSAAERARELLHFALPGRRAVMVAVSAFGPSSGFAGAHEGDLPETFGRGYAREDLRSIVHLCAPCSLSQYAQELSLLSPQLDPVARPNLRDVADEEDNQSSEDHGLSDPADCSDETNTQQSFSARQRQNVALMLFNPAHLALNLALLERKRPHPESLTAVVDQFRSHAVDSWINEKSFIAPTGGSQRDALICLRFLEDSGAIERQGSQLRTKLSGLGLRKVSEELAAAFLTLREGDEHRLQEVENYARSQGCRSQTLARKFGHSVSNETCGQCDVCSPLNSKLRNTPGNLNLRTSELTSVRTPPLSVVAPPLPGEVPASAEISELPTRSRRSGKNGLSFDVQGAANKRAARKSPARRNQNVVSESEQAELIHLAEAVGSEKNAL